MLYLPNILDGQVDPTFCGAGEIPSHSAQLKPVYLLIMKSLYIV